MKFTIRRISFTADGIFGILQDGKGDTVAYTLEHAYAQPQIPIGGPMCYLPKVPVGTYTCRRGQHHLGSKALETFEVTGVKGHSGILFHPGNRQDDSHGCILVGLGIDGAMITRSRDAFELVMKLAAGVDEFELDVKA